MDKLNEVDDCVFIDVDKLLIESKKELTAQDIIDSV